MQQYLRLTTFILTLLLFSCQSEQQEINSSDSSFDRTVFDESYKNSKEVSLGIEKRLENINLAYNEAENLSLDSLKIKVLLEKTKLHSKNKQQDSAIYYSKRLLDLSIKSIDSSSIAAAYFKLGLYYNRNQEQDASFEYYSKSKKINQALGDTIAVVNSLLNMAILSSGTANYMASDEVAIEALSFIKNIDLPTQKASLYNCIAINARNQKEYKEALYWYDLAILATNNDNNRTIYRSNVANIYRIQGDYPKAIALYKSLLNDLKKNTNQNHYIRNLNNLNYAIWLQSRDPALEDEFLKSLASRKKINNISGQITSLRYLIEFYLYMNSNQAKFYAKNMYQLSKDVNNIDDRLESLQLLMLAYDQDPKQYNEYAKNFIFLEDSIQQVKTQLGNKYAKIRFDSDRNRNENTALKTANLQKELQLSQSKQMNTLYMALGVISLISFFFIFRLSRSKYQKEKLQEIYLTETRISKKVHDEVANDLYGVMLSLEKDQPEEKETILDDLEQIYEKTRDISRENNTLDLNHDFNDLLNDLLLGYKSDQVNIITKGMQQVNLNALSITKRIVLYRVIQELMTNMKKHSQASIVTLLFKEDKNKISITYRDDGLGCDIKKSNGLINAENRINSINGKFILSSEKNKGFKATILI